MCLCLLVIICMLPSQVQQYEMQMQLLQEGRLVEASRITTGIGAAVSDLHFDLGTMQTLNLDV